MHTQALDVEYCSWAAVTYLSPVLLDTTSKYFCSTWIDSKESSKSAARMKSNLQQAAADMTLAYRAHSGIIANKLPLGVGLHGAILCQESRADIAPLHAPSQRCIVFFAF